MEMETCESPGGGGARDLLEGEGDAGVCPGAMEMPEAEPSKRRVPEASKA
jgi:hypothetical protein